MKRPPQSIILSASAVATAVGSLAHMVEQNPSLRVWIQDPGIESQAHQEAMDLHRPAIQGAFTGVAAEVALRQHMGTVLPAVDVDPKSMHDAWLHMATFDNLSNSINMPGNTTTGTPGTGNWRGALYGHHSDSTFDIGADDIGGCYTNCHSACHGSRGWR
jgi:hypothetical protein